MRTAHLTEAFRGGFLRTIPASAMVSTMTRRSPELRLLTYDANRSARTLPFADTADSDQRKRRMTLERLTPTIIERFEKREVFRWSGSSPKRISSNPSPSAFAASRATTRRFCRDAPASRESTTDFPTPARRACTRAFGRSVESHPTDGDPIPGHDGTRNSFSVMTSAVPPSQLPSSRSSGTEQPEPGTESSCKQECLKINGASLENSERPNSG